jgi:hypothetical protein
VGDANASGPVEQHDLSGYATSENHVAKVGAYLYARRTLSTHTATVRIKAGNQTGTVVEGGIVQVYLQVITSREPASVINRYYVVESIGHSLAGEETLSLSHFPVNSSGQSLIALAVAAATGTGTILPSNRTGGSCDIAGASNSTTVPSKTTSETPIASQGTGGSYWAAGGQFLDLFGGAGAPSDSPPDPAGGGLANNGGTIPPSDGTNSAGGDSRCPNGYSRVTGGIVWYQITGGGDTDYSQRTTGFAARGFPVITNYTTSRYGNWEVEEYTITWTDADTGLAAGGAYTAGNLKYLPGGGPAYGLEIAASSYSCSLDDGSAGPTVSNASGVPKLYQTREGDTMASISLRFYGTTGRAADIQAANPWLMGLDNWGLSGQWLLTLPN